VTELLDRAATATGAGIDIELGGTGFTGVGAWAWMQVAAIVGNPYPVGEIGGWLDHGMPESTCSTAIPMRDGHLLTDDAPGHGGQLNEAALRKYTTRYIDETRG
jgi:L-alanine-DL-glutamate epimerase-like enolase superfamily enzyme